MRRIRPIYFDHAIVGLGLAAMLVLAGCTDMPAWSGMSVVPTAGQIQAVRGLHRSYVYFAGYETYYERASSLYTYRVGARWVTRPEPPPGVTVEQLETSPSVVLDFAGAPQGHHAAVVRSYPRNWGRAQTIMAATR